MKLVDGILTLDPGEEVNVRGQKLKTTTYAAKDHTRVQDGRPYVPPVTTPPESPPPVGSDIPGWTLVWDETFDKPCAEGQFAATYPNIYFYPWQWKDTAEKMAAGKGSFYDQNIISVHDGMLDAHIRTINGVRHVAAFGPRLGAYGQGWETASRIGMRTSIEAQVVGDRYYKGAWLWWPQSDIWPAEQEVDWPEGNFGGTDRNGLPVTASGYLHWPDNRQDVFPSTARFSDWHTYLNEWKPGAYWAFGLDGVEKVRYSGLTSPDANGNGGGLPKVPSTPHRWIVQNETNLDGLLPPSTSEAHIYVRRMQVWIPTP